MRTTTHLSLTILDCSSFDPPRIELYATSWAAHLEPLRYLGTSEVPFTDDESQIESFVFDIGVTDSTFVSLGTIRS